MVIKLVLVLSVMVRPLNVVVGSVISSGKRKRFIVRVLVITDASISRIRVV